MKRQYKQPAIVRTFVALVPHQDVAPFSEAERMYVSFVDGVRVERAGTEASDIYDSLRAEFPGAAVSYPRVRSLCFVHHIVKTY